MTQAKFLAEYRELLRLAYDWAREAQLDRFMRVVKATIEREPGQKWLCEGGVVESAWLNIGGKGRVTLAKLRNLPKE